MNTRVLDDESHSRGYLPHYVRAGAFYFVTFRLADSLPREILSELERELKSLDITNASENRNTPRIVPQNRRPNTDIRANSAATRDREKRKRIEAYLDRGTGAAHLKDERIATIARDALQFFDGQRYELDEWVIMPNHVHALVRPFPPWRLRDILHTWKLNIARRANAILGVAGQRFWQPESFDRIIRDDEEKAAVRRYIRQNPVKARLCSEDREWKFSSCSAGF